MPRYKVTGPQGGAIVRRASVQRIAKSLPALVQRFGRVSVTAATPEPHELELARRRAIVGFCRWAIEHEPAIHYAQERPMERLRTPAQLQELPRFADCSELATDAYAYAGAPDPNGTGYDGTGYTGTLLLRGRRLPSAAAAKPGDLVVYGAGTGRHVAVVIEAGADPLLCSHGQERGPLAIRHSDEARYQAGPAVFLTYDLGGHA